MKKRSILIVDDDALTLQVTAMIIESEGVQVNCAASGEEAVGVLMEIDCAMVITDLNMAGMDGYELAMLAKELYPSIRDDNR